VRRSRPSAERTMRARASGLKVLWPRRRGRIGPATPQPATSLWVACKQRVVRYVVARSSLWFRYGLLGFFRLPASPFQRCRPHSAHHNPPYNRDAGAPEKVTAPLRRKLPLLPAKGLPRNPFPTQAQTSRMNPLSRVSGTTIIAAECALPEQLVQQQRHRPVRAWAGNGCAPARRRIVLV
jgi:hypothetical protein